MENKHLAVIGIVIMVVIIYIQTKMPYPTPHMEPATQASVAITPPPSINVSLEDRQKIEADISTILQELEHYPIEGLRVQYKEFFEKLITGKIGVILNPAKVRFIAGIDNCNNKVNLIIVVDSWLRARRNLDRETFKDRFMLTLLHENYHYTHGHLKNNDREMRIQNEAETWGYEMNLLKNIVETRGSKILEKDNQMKLMLGQYLSFHEDAYNPLWINFIRKIHEGQEFKDCN